MAIDEAAVRHVARLAGLDLTDDEVRAYGAQLAAILGHVERIAALDLDGVEPLAPKPATMLRDDRVAPGLSRDEALANAPERDAAAFLVPRIIDEG